MNTYKYKAISNNGTKVSGIVEAYDEYEAVARIKTENAIVESIKEVQKRKFENFDINEPLWVEDKVLALTASQFAILLKAGLPTAKTVEVIAQQASDRLMKRILREVASDVAAGYSLAASLETRGKKIPVTFIETVRAGEESGTLETSFRKLEEYYNKKSILSGKVKSAMIYPAILMVLVVLVIVIVVKVAVPTVAGVITSTGGEMPGVTQFLLNTYDFFSKYGFFVLLGIIALVIGFMMWKKTEKGHYITADMAMKIPVIGKVNQMNTASQFASTMVTLLSAGLSTSRSVQITGKVMDNYAAGSEVAKASVGLEEGKRLGDVLGGNQYLPILLVEMAAVGEESGSLEDTLTTIGMFYDKETEQATARALSLMEPIITVVLGIVIGFIVVALYMPMFTMYSNM